MAAARPARTLWGMSSLTWTDTLALGQPRQVRMSGQRHAR